MSYDTPHPADEVGNESEEENGLASKKADSPPQSPTRPDDVNLDDGSDENGVPVDNPAG